MTDDTKNPQDPTITEGEIVSSTSSESPGTEILLNMENMVKSHMQRIATLKEESTKHKEMLADIFTNHEVFQHHDKAAKEAAKLKQKTKQEILKQPNVRQLSEKIKEMKTELKDLEGALSDYLKEYVRLSGSQQFQTDEGEVLDIVYTAKLVRHTA